MNNKTKFKKIFSIAILAFVLFVGVFYFAPVLAESNTADTFGIESVENNISLGGGDVRVTIAKIIRAVLGLLGLIAVIIVIYGGFVYMTSNGEEDKIAKGKKILINGVIGLVIILSSFIIVQFVLNALADATGLDTHYTDLRCRDVEFALAHPTICYDGTLPDICELQHFVVTSITPVTNQTGMNNVAVRTIFSQQVDYQAGDITIKYNGSDISADFNFVVQGTGESFENSMIEAQYTGTSTCASGIKCLPFGSYKVEVSRDISDSRGNSLETETDCGDYPNIGYFTVINKNNIITDNLAYFNGASAYIKSSLTFSFEDISLSVWIKPELDHIESDQQKTYSIFQSGFFGNDGIYNLLIGDPVDNQNYRADEVGLIWRYGKDGSDFIRLGTVDQLSQKWTNIIITHSKNSGYSIFIDGILKGKVEVLNEVNKMGVNDKNIFIGGYDSYPNDNESEANASYFKGAIHNFYLFKKSLTSEEVKELYNSGVGFRKYDFNGAFVHLGLNEGSDEEIEDDSDNGINIVVSNLEWRQQESSLPGTDFVEDTTSPTVSDIKLIDNSVLNGSYLVAGETYEFYTEIVDKIGDLDGGAGCVHMNLRKVGSTSDGYNFFAGPSIARGSDTISINPYTFEYERLRIPANATPLENYLLTLDVSDIDNNHTIVTSTFTVIPSHCLNGELDGDEIAIDVGGSCGSTGYCSQDSDCPFTYKCVDSEPAPIPPATGDYKTKTCQPFPYISDVDPMDGGSGNWISILGYNFGSYVDNNVTGTVEFGLDNNSDDEPDEWIQTSIVSCGDNNEPSWNSDWVVIEVPENDILPTDSLSAIRLNTARKIRMNGEFQNLQDTTIDDWGGNPGPKSHRGWFLKNDILRPGLCNVENEKIDYIGSPLGMVNDPVKAIGKGFGSSGSLYFNNIQSNIRGWSESWVTSFVPNLDRGRVPVLVESGGEKSNKVPFNIVTEEDDILPVITIIDPATTTPGSYITIVGRNFGNDPGVVYLSDLEGGERCGNDTDCSAMNLNMPLFCGDTWSDNQIVVEVPDDIDFLDSVKEEILYIDPNNTLKYYSNNTYAIRQSFNPSNEFNSLDISVVLDCDGQCDGDIQLDINGNLCDPILASSVRTDGLISDYTWYTTTCNVNSNQVSKPFNVTLQKYTGFGTVRFLVEESGPEGEPQYSSNNDSWTNDNGDYFLKVILSTENFLNNYLTIKNNLNLYSSGENNFEIYNDDSLPGICYLYPSSGPAPLADGGTLAVKGINFSTNPTVYFFTKESKVGNRNSVDGWLYTPFNGTFVLTLESEDGGQRINTPIPYNENYGYSMRTGLSPIKLKDINNNFSNSIYYNVTDCRSAISTVPTDFQCCLEGEEAGQIKPNTIGCIGEPKNAGYVWRFTTGLLPNNPYVIVSCDQDNWDDPTAEVEMPSPVPSTDWDSGENACVNSIISVSFGPEGVTMDEDSFNSSTVKLYRCDNIVGENIEGCESILLEPIQSCEGTGCIVLENDTLNIYIPPQDYIPNTWYHVELMKGIQSQESFIELGVTQIKHSPLRADRELVNPVDDDDKNNVAFYFNFKTGSNQCVLTDAWMNPDQYTTHLLGVIQNPGFRFDYNNIFNPPHPMYYYLSGKGDQECSVIDVEGLGWEWETSSSTLATSDIAPSSEDEILRRIYTDSRGTATAWMDTYPDDVTIFASTNVEGHCTNNTEVSCLNNNDCISFTVPLNSIPSENICNGAQTITATSSLMIDLSDPKVVEYWPNCIEACVNTQIAARFNMLMMTDTYDSGVKLYQCVDEECTSFVDNNGLNIDVGADSDWNTIRFYPNEMLEANTWYLVQLNDGIKSIGGFVRNKNGEITETKIGKPLNEFSWKFRTKNSSSPCLAESVDIIPDPLYVYSVGDKTKIQAQPNGSPDSCSPYGQALNPWFFTWDWNSYNGDIFPSNVFSITKLSTSNSLNPYCGKNCLYNGSDISRNVENVFVCGNGIVEPGEDCDIAVTGETAGESCIYNCLRPGNSDFVSATSTVDIGKCGDGFVSSTLGEECDPGIVVQKNYCTTQCLWKGSKNVYTSEPSVSYCGSGTVTGGEDCDIASTITTNQGKIGCSDNCLHEGTRLSQAWCDGGHEDESACQNAAAYSWCGNGIIETGEECELYSNTDEDVDYRISFNNNYTSNFSTTTGYAHEYCNSSCLLQNLCDVNIQSDLYCEAGTEGCNSDCTLAGSSALYSESSVCGDSEIGYGEYGSCEVTSSSLLAQYGISTEGDLGQSPVQITTAIGEDESVVEIPDLKGIKGQAASSSAKTVGYFDDETIVQLSGEDIKEGLGDYYLVCGFSEFGELQSGKYNLCPSNNDNKKGVARNSCCYERPNRVNEYPVDGDGFSGEGVCRNTYIEAVFDEYLNAQTIDNSTFGLVSGHTESNYNCSIDEQNIEHERIDNLGESLMDLAGIIAGESGYSLIDDNTNKSVEVVSDIVNLDSSFTLEIRFVYKEQLSQGSTKLISKNDAYYLQYFAGLGFNNGLCFVSDGVSVCNKEKPVVGQDYHYILTWDGTVMNWYNMGGLMSSNTVSRIAISENQFYIGEPKSRAMVTNANLYKLRIINEAVDGDVRNKMFGIYPSTIVGGGMDVTDEINAILAKDPEGRPDDLASSGSFFGRIWYGIKTFFAWLFGVDANASGSYDLVGSIKVWCTVPTPLTLDVSAEYNTTMTESGKIIMSNATTTISAYLQDLLASSTVYGVVMRGGANGIQDHRGVGIKNSHEDNLNINDLFVFKTGDQICKIDQVTVDPDNYLFDTPNTEKLFRAFAINNDGAKIVSTPAYEWEWSWGPVGHPVFNIPNVHIVTNTIEVSGLEGSVFGVAQAKIINDVSTENNHLGRIFTGLIELNAFFCENPWPLRVGDSWSPYTDEFYGFSFSYCADDGMSGDTGDDLPYFDNFSLLHGDLTAINTLSTSHENNKIYGKDLKEIAPTTITTSIQQRTLYFNDANDDVLGIQVFQNGEGFDNTAVSWYAKEFPDAPTPESIEIANDDSGVSYKGVREGNNYYINAQNIKRTNGENFVVYNNIYAFSVNEGANADTLNVLAQIIDSLSFNLSLQDYNYCLTNDLVGLTKLPMDENLQAAISEVSCSSDFDCRDTNGAPLEGTNGICSNAKTKLFRDIDRLGRIKTIQFALDTYFNTYSSDAYNFKGNLKGGTYIPGYTVSTWPSWNKTLGSYLNTTLPLENINTWTACTDGDAESQTCWNATESTYYCPAYSSVFEYEYVSSTGSYMLHAPLEFLNINSNFAKDINISTFTEDPYCQGETFSLKAGICGDGIIQPGSGEECDPPGSKKIGTKGYINTKYGKCNYDDYNRECLTNEECSGSSLFEDDGVQRIVPYNSDTKVCQTADSGVIYNSDLMSDDKRYIFPCPNENYCRIGTPFMGDVGFKTFGLGLSDEFAGGNQTFICETLSMAKYFSKSESADCVGAVVGGRTDCSLNYSAISTCGNDCKIDYGVCKSSISCGNGIVEIGEACDDGALNGQYGQCAGPDSKKADGSLVGACKGLHEQYCGNYEGILYDSISNVVDKTETGAPLELCDFTQEPETKRAVVKIINNFFYTICKEEDDWNFTYLGDLLVDLTDFVNKYHSVKEYLNYTYDDLLKSGYIDVKFGDLNVGDLICRQLQGEDCDKDGIGSSDNCPVVANEDQTDSDEDGIGDDCDLCPNNANVIQTDSDEDGIGDDCDSCPNNANAGEYQDIEENDANNNNVNDYCDSDFQDLEKFVSDFYDDPIEIEKIEVSVKNICQNNIGYCSNNSEYACRNNADCVISSSNLDFQDGSINLENIFENLNGKPQSLGICVSAIRPYAFEKQYSCAWDCQNYGQYCGDGVQNGNEECDDGNTINNDLCNNDCKIIVDPVICGDGKTGVGERCDLGKYCENITEKDLTKVCTSDSDCAGIGDGKCITRNIKYKDGNDQFYCSTDCMTKTPYVPKCGNGILDQGEFCDTGVNVGEVCRPGYGQSCNYCSSDCKKIFTIDSPSYCGNGRVDIIDGNNTSEACDIKDGKVINNNNKNEVLACVDQGEYFCSSDCMTLSNTCYSCEDGYAIPKLSLINVTGQDEGGLHYVNFFRYPMNNLSTKYIDSYSKIFILDDGIYTREECANKYGFYFTTTGTNFKGDKFAFPVSLEQDPFYQNFIFSPVVSEGAFRAVVVWEDEDNNFSPDIKVYNKDFSNITPNGNDIIDIYKYINILCDKNDYKSDCYSVRDSGILYFHKIVEGQNNLKTMAITIDTESNNSVNSNYNIFIGNLNQNKMGQLRNNNQNIKVYLYAYHPGQEDYSIYNPIKIFDINESYPTNPDDSYPYWHVFDLNKNQEGEYEYSSVYDGRENGEILQNGSELITDNNTYTAYEITSKLALEFSGPVGISGSEKLFNLNLIYNDISLDVNNVSILDLLDFYVVDPDGEEKEVYYDFDDSYEIETTTLSIDFKDLFDYDGFNMQNNSKIFFGETTFSFLRYLFTTPEAYTQIPELKEYFPMFFDNELFFDNKPDSMSIPSLTHEYRNNKIYFNLENYNLKNNIVYKLIMRLKNKEEINYEPLGYGNYIWDESATKKYYINSNNCNFNWHKKDLNGYLTEMGSYFNTTNCDILNPNKLNILPDYEDKFGFLEKDFFFTRDSEFENIKNLLFFNILKKDTWFIGQEDSEIKEEIETTEIFLENNKNNKEIELYTFEIKDKQYDK